MATKLTVVAVSTAALGGMLVWVGIAFGVTGVVFAFAVNWLAMCWMRQAADQGPGASSSSRSTKPPATDSAVAPSQVFGFQGTVGKRRGSVG